MKTDREYEAYIQTKTLSELLELADQVDPKKLPTRHSLILSRIEKLKKESPEAYSAAHKDKKYDTITRRILANLVDTLILYAAVFLSKQFLKEPLSITEDQSAMIAQLACLGLFTIGLLRSGQTPGMKITEVRLLQLSETKASWYSILFNEFINLGLLLLLFFVFAQFVEINNSTERLVLGLFGVINVGIMSLNAKRRSISEFLSKTVFISTKYVA